MVMAYESYLPYWHLRTQVQVQVKHQLRISIILHWHWVITVQVQVKHPLSLCGHGLKERVLCPTLALGSSGPSPGKTSTAHVREWSFCNEHWHWVTTYGPSPGKTFTKHAWEWLRPANCPTLALWNSGPSPGKNIHCACVGIIIV